MRWTMLSLISDGCDRYFSICPESCGYKPAGFVVFARAINVYVSMSFLMGFMLKKQCQSHYMLTFKS
jgi:hypothetical protein